MSVAVSTRANREAEGELYSQVLDDLREFAFFSLDASGRIVSWNQGAERLTGFQRHEVLGELFTQLGEPDPRVPLSEVLESVQETGRFAQERWWRRRDGALIWIDELINPLSETQSTARYLVVARDLTARVEAEERLLAGQAREEEGLTRERKLRAELQAAERRAAFLSEASSILAASAINFESTVRSLARLAVSRLGDWCIVHALDNHSHFQCVEVAHRDPRKEALLEQLSGEDLSDAWREHVRSVLQTGQAQLLEHLPSMLFDRASDEQREALLAGAATPTSAMVTPLLGRGKVLGALTIVAAESGRTFDEADLELAEELGRRAAIAMDNARLYREAQEANRAKADFLAVMSHELRTPLNAIMGYTDLMDAEVSGPISDKQRQQVGRIRASARHLLQLIEEILSYARMEAGAEEVSIGTAVASDIVRDACALVQPLADAKGLELAQDVTDGDVILESDIPKVRQVLLNLLSNAVKFTERGTVTLRFRADGNDAVFEVEDTGIGIPPDQQHQIFDPFWQAERPNTRRVGGTGLGLSVSRRYARILDGEITVRSEPGRGAVFTVRMPLRPARRRVSSDEN